MKETARGFLIFGEWEEDRHTGRMHMTESSGLGLDRVHVYVEGVNLKAGPPWPEEPDAKVCFTASEEQTQEIIDALQSFLDTRKERQEMMYGPAED